MKYILFFIIQLAITFHQSSGVASEDFRVTLYVHQLVSLSSTNEWVYSADLLKKESFWEPGKTDPPIALGKIVQLAKEWVVSKGSKPDPKLINIEIRCLNSSGGEYSNVYFYNLRFGDVGYFGHYIRCIVLMDGTVVEPSRNGKLINTHVYADYAE
jgi:hypothetical protein